MNSELTAKILIDNAWIGTADNSYAWQITVSIGNIKTTGVITNNEDIYAHIGRLLTQCMREMSFSNLIRLNNIKAFE